MVAMAFAGSRLPIVSSPRSNFLPGLSANLPANGIKRARRDNKNGWLNYFVKICLSRSKQVESIADPTAGAIRRACGLLMAFGPLKLR
jgi:hypothetical protein